MLSNVKFACFGLGSAYYEKDYCKFMYPAHEHMEALGATALQPVKRGDDQSGEFVMYLDILILKNLNAFLGV